MAASGHQGTSKWLVDLGASSHICTDGDYMNNFRNTQEKVTIVDSSSVTATGRGTASLVTSEGHKLDLDECLYIPEFDQNICSLERFARKGHNIKMTLPWIKVWSKNKKQSLNFKRDGNL